LIFYLEGNNHLRGLLLFMPFSPQNSQALALGSFLLHGYANMNANLLYHDIKVSKSCSKFSQHHAFSLQRAHRQAYSRIASRPWPLVPVTMLKETIAVTGLLILQPAGFSHDCTKYYNNVL
jgi:hypothetical protein